MSWSIGFDRNWKRDIGYGVPAVCDYPGCDAEIHRGLSYVCGSNPHGGEYGCGLFFCSEHLTAEGRDGDLVELCDRCATAKEPHEPKPDTTEWLQWKLTDDSWQQWREENPTRVAMAIMELGAR